MDTVKAVKAIAYGLRHKPGWRTHPFKAIEYPPELKHPKHEALWEEYRKIYCDLALDPLVRQEKSDEFYETNKNAMNEGVVETWPQKWPYRSIREKEFESGRPFILREYQNLPVDRAMAWFPMDEAITFETERYGLMRFRRSVRLLRRRLAARQFSWTGRAQVKLGSKTATLRSSPSSGSPCPNGGMMTEQRLPAYGYVYSVTLLRGSRGQQLDAHIKGLFDARAFLAGRASRPDFYLRCEEIVDPTGDIKKNFETVYNQLRTKYKFSESVEYVRRIKHKDHRIEALQSPIANGWLCFSTELSELYMDQMRHFPYGDFNDGPDATEGAWSNPVVVTSAQHREQRRMWREQVKEEGKPHVFYSYV